MRAQCAVTVSLDQQLFTSLFFSLSLPGEFLYAPACICGLVSQYDLGSSIAELKGKKASDFMDKSLLNELESEGFFAGLQGQKTR